MRPYRPRRITFHDVRDLRGFRLKTYTIVYDGGPIDPADFDGAWGLMGAGLPAPAATDDRPGVGFVVLHRGRGVDYAVLGWWDRENELPLRVFVRDHGAGSPWRPARGGESVCVWDLEVIGSERDAYVETVLAPSGPDVAGYLDRHVGG